MPTKEQLTADLTAAMRAGDEVRKSTLRMLLTAVKNAEVSGSERKDLSDEQVMQVVAKQVKQRKESIDEFKKASRHDLVEKETAELIILEAYMPEQMGRDEIAAEVRKAIEEVGAKGPQDKGKLMQVLMPRLSGKAEGREINAVVTELLSAAGS
ncbi:MAG: GatB/YqeY domain-containing protein [Chloroflexota bacterium]